MLMSPMLESMSVEVDGCSKGVCFMQRYVFVRIVATCLITSCLSFGQPTRRLQESDILRQGAEAAANKGEWSDAASLYRSAIGWEQNSTWAYRGLGDAYRANGLWGKAADQYDAASAIDPTLEALKQLASLCRRAAAELQTDSVKSATLGALGEFPWSWLQGQAGPTRDLEFRPKNKSTADLRIPISLLFPRDKFTLDALPAAAIHQLEEVAQVVAMDRPLKIVVEVNTCRCGSDAANLELARRRGEAVRDFFITKRLVQPGDILTMSYGASRPVEQAGAPTLPVAVCDRDEHHVENRRVVIVIFGRPKIHSDGSTRLDVSFLSRRAGRPNYESLSDGSQIRIGDEYRIRLSAVAPVYAYAFHRGSSGKWDVLFPDKMRAGQTRPFSNPLELGQDVSIPTIDAGFLLKGYPGPEETYVYSRGEPDAALEALVSAYQSGKELTLLPPILVDGDSRAGPPSSVTRPAASSGKPVATTNSSAAKPLPAPSAPKPIEGEKQVLMRTVGERDISRPDETPRLPQRPAAYVRFKTVK